MREEQYRKIFEISPVGILVQDEEGNILEVNNKLCEITNYNKDELEGRSIFDTLINFEKTEKIQEIMERILAGDDLSLTKKFRKKSGEVYYARLEKTRFKLPEGEEDLLSMLMDITMLKEKEANLEYLSYHDGLTDLYNRSYLEKEMARLDTERQLPVSLIMCDVNRLKLVNDTYGHNKGDELLINVADILRECTRSEDIVSRWAGDEFVVLLPQTEAEEAERVVRRIEDTCEGAELEDILITLSVGRATRINMEEELKEVLSRADERMYRDKITRINNYENRLIKNMLDSLAAKSAEARRHTQRMTELAYKLGEEIDLSNDKLNRLTLLSELHDIGKITISENILRKSGGLSEKEWQEIKKHPEKGHTVLSATDEFTHIAREVLHHHERWDGTGYPEELKREEIPLLSRIIAIVDAYDVMTTGRPYQEPISKEKALTEIEVCAGSQFDPELAEKFIELMSR
nr:diguanylate cyclase [Halarsenatibacter silvermanii]